MSLAAQLAPYATILGVVWGLLFGGSSLSTVVRSLRARTFRFPSQHALTNILLLIANVLLLAIFIVSLISTINYKPQAPITYPVATTTKALAPTATETNRFTTPNYNPFLNAPLSHQDTNEWDERTYSDGGCHFSGGFYEASVTQEGHRNYCTTNAPSDSFTDFVYEVQMKIIKGDCGGLVFRIGSISSDAYSFEVCQDGTFDVAVYSEKIPTYLIYRSPNPAFQTGVNQYVLAVIAKKNSLTFYVNNQEVGQVNDTTYTTGEIGIFAHAYTNYPTIVAYRNAKVWLG